MHERGKMRGWMNRDDGAAIVEMAIVLPILLLLLIGVFEIGALFRDFLTTSNSVREGTRLLSAKGDAPTADCNAIKAAVEAMSSATEIDRIQSIQIFEADSNGDQIGGETNTYLYTGSPLDKCTLSTDPVVEYEGWRLDLTGEQYTAAERTVLVGADPLDLVGMRIIYTHSWLTGFPPFSGTVTIDEQTILRLEPQGVATS